MTRSGRALFICCLLGATCRPAVAGDGGLSDPSLLARGRQACEEGRYEAAIGDLEKFLAGVPSPERVPLALQFLARSYYHADGVDDHLRRAAETYAKLGREHAASPLAADAFYWCGRIYHQLDDAASAVKAYEAFLRHRPRHDLADQARIEMARLLVDLGKAPEAVKVLDAERLCQGDDQLQAAYRRAHNLLCTGAAEQALSAFEQTTGQYQWADSRLEPFVLFEYAEALAGAKRWDAAAQRYRELLERHPHHPHAAPGRFNLGVALFNQGQVEQALEVFAASLEVGPPTVHAGSLYWAARCRQALDQKDEARAAFIAVMKDYPQTDWAKWSETALANMAE